MATAADWCHSGTAAMQNPSAAEATNATHPFTCVPHVTNQPALSTANPQLSPARHSVSPPCGRDPSAQQSPQVPVPDPHAHKTVPAHGPPCVGLRTAGRVGGTALGAHPVFPRSPTSRPRTTVLSRSRTNCLPPGALVFIVLCPFSMSTTQYRARPVSIPQRVTTRLLHCYPLSQGQETRSFPATSLFREIPHPPGQFCGTTAAWIWHKSRVHGPGSHHHAARSTAPCT